MFCSYCGTQIADGAGFCACCGTPQGQNNTENTVLQTQWENSRQPDCRIKGESHGSQPRKSSKVLHRVLAVEIVILCAVLLALFLAIHFHKSDEELINDRIDEFLTAYNSGDMAGVAECLDARSRNSLQSMLNIGNAMIGSTGYGIGISDLFGVSIGAVSDGDVLKVTDRSITIESDTSATVTAVLTYQDKYSKMTDYAVFTMVKEDGDWYIKDLEEKE